MHLRQAVRGELRSPSPHAAFVKKLEAEASSSTNRFARFLLTLIARNGRIAHFETHGVMDIETEKPMQQDGIFRIMSMTKPVVGVSIMMLVEVRLPSAIERGWDRIRAAPLTAG